jgi:hypothetical protein
MKIGDRVLIKGMLDEHGSLIVDKCAGEQGTIIDKGTLFPYIVKFDIPVFYEDDKYWEDMPFHEAELELLC